MLFRNNRVSDERTHVSNRHSDLQNKILVNLNKQAYIRYFLIQEITHFLKSTLNDTVMFIQHVLHLKIQTIFTPSVKSVIKVYG